MSAQDDDDDVDDDIVSFLRLVWLSPPWNDDDLPQLSADRGRRRQQEAQALSISSPAFLTTTTTTTSGRKCGFRCGGLSSLLYLFETKEACWDVGTSRTTTTNEGGRRLATCLFGRRLVQNCLSTEPRKL